MTELKPCPFCGPGTQVTKYRDDYDHWRVACGACGLHTGFNPRDTNGSETVARWNTRPKSEAEELLELLHERRGSLHCYAASRCVVDYPDSDYAIERDTPLDALRAAREAMEDEN